MAGTLYLQVIDVLRRDLRFSGYFQAALQTGELTDAARRAIAGAFDVVFERNRRLADIFLNDMTARAEIVRFCFARSYAEVQAAAEFQAAFKTAIAAVREREARA